jgi:Flp pilus assembly protein TadD
LTILYWLGEVYRGLGDASSEAAAWQQYARLSSTPAEVCPALPLALTKIGDAPGALQAYETCVGWEPDDPERLVDLAAEYERRGRMDLARATYQRVLTADPGDPRIARRMTALADAGVK